MNTSALVIALVTLAAGLAIGWLLSQSRAQARLRSAHAEAVMLRTALDADRDNAARREELLARNGDVAGLVGPLRESLERVQQQLTVVEHGRLSSDTALREQVLAMSRNSEHLRTQTGQLVTALRAPQVRGRWGEMQLERIVEAAGMTEHVDYVTQASSSHADGTLRPDLVVRLTAGKNIVVDSKVACSAYLEAMEATDERERDARLRAHARQMRAHIDALSAKAYWERFAPSPEFVVCFVPADSFLDAALREDPTLLEHAFTHDVVLATPSTLVALLRTVAYGWRQESLAANAKQVHDLGRDLYKRLATLGTHFERLGRNLGNAVGAYNDAVGSMERMVLVKARQLSELGVVDPHATLRHLEPLTGAVAREVAAPEFTDQRVVTLPTPRASHTGQ
ncbi:MAG: DNA recombination protein RmuC [Actinomycetota bacterium]|nr:DNA recombination protein RmuC [Actinomycetota bacterium]